MKALIFNIQRFSLHDGPGIRTTVFFKGCPLHCTWCCNPESQSTKKQIMINHNNCSLCLTCLASCPYQAFTLQDKIVNDNELCQACGECLKHCPHNCLSLIGVQQTVEDLYLELIKDKAFYDNSQGGVTFSGGEPLLYDSFILQLITKLKQEKINCALERLREKEVSFTDSQRFKNYGDLILSNIASIKPDDKWLEAEDGGSVIRIELEPRVKPVVNAEKYYERYRKAKNGLAEIQREIEAGEKELKEITEKLEKLLSETNPIVLSKLAKTVPSTRFSGVGSSKKEKNRPGLTFKRGDWLILVGRDASENDELLRRHAKGNDIWLHVRDYHGSYVFIRHRSGKTVPLDILLDAGNLALFYSKGRNNGEGDLFYTHTKYLRRTKTVSKGRTQLGQVIPTQEKNLHIKLDETRLRSLEDCRIS